MEVSHRAWIIAALLLILSLKSVVRGQNGTLTVWVFGDSLVDPGNNNYLAAALAKADFRHNGIDFPGWSPTGRFCNGRTVVDVLCDLIGLPYPSVALAPATQAGAGIQTGVNYASAAGGILDATGANYIERLSMNTQIGYFKTNLAQLQAQLGTEQATALLGNALCTIVMGSSDFIDNYLLTTTTTKEQYPDTRTYNILLLHTLNWQLTTLYSLGFRRFVVSAVGPLGCIPNQLYIANRGPNCILSTNAQVQDFSNGLNSLVTQLTADLPGSQFLYANAYDAVDRFIVSPGSYGFTVTNMGCCGIGMYNGAIICLPVFTPCPDRSKYIFWDPFHPTESANILLANGIFSGGPRQISPSNIKQLLGL